MSESVRLLRPNEWKGKLPASGEWCTAEPGAELKSWALVELFGHQRIVGWVTVDPVDFPGMLRVDVPDLKKDGKTVREGFTRYFGRGALYSVTPIDEASVRELLPHVSGRPARAAALTEEY